MVVRYCRYHGYALYGGDRVEVLPEYMEREEELAKSQDMQAKSGLFVLPIAGGGEYMISEAWGAREWGG